MLKQAILIRTVEGERCAHLLVLFSKLSQRTVVSLLFRSSNSRRLPSLAHTVLSTYSDFLDNTYTFIKVKV